MKVRVCSKAEAEIFGATHYAIVDYTDLSPTAGLTLTLNVLPGTTNGVMPALGTSGTDTFLAGMKVSVVAVIVDATFTGGAISACSLSVGDAGSSTRYINAQTVFTGTAPLYYVGVIAAQPFVYTSADKVNAVFTSVTANLSALTKGSCRIFFQAVDLTQLPPY